MTGTHTAVVVQVPEIDSLAIEMMLQACMTCDAQVWMAA